MTSYICVYISLCEKFHRIALLWPTLGRCNIRTDCNCRWDSPRKLRSIGWDFVKNSFVEKCSRKPKELQFHVSVSLPRWRNSAATIKWIASNAYFSPPLSIASASLSLFVVCDRYGISCIHFNRNFVVKLLYRLRMRNNTTATATARISNTNISCTRKSNRADDEAETANHRERERKKQTTISQLWQLFILFYIPEN